jgi:hypothetical protein
MPLRILTALDLLTYRHTVIPVRHQAFRVMFSDFISVIRCWTKHKDPATNVLNLYSQPYLAQML